MAGQIMPATGIIEARQFMFVDDDATYDLTVLRFNDGDIVLSVEVTANGASTCVRADLTLSADQANIVAGALLGVAAILHVEDRRIAFVADDTAYGIGVHSSGGCPGIKLRQSFNESGSVFVPLGACYAKLVGCALSDLAQNAAEEA